MSLLFNMLLRFVIAFLPRRKHHLISWLLSPATVILEPKEIKSVSVSNFSPSIYHDTMGLDAMILVFLNVVLSYLFHSPLSLDPHRMLKNNNNNNNNNNIHLGKNKMILVDIFATPICQNNSLELEERYVVH